MTQLFEDQFTEAPAGPEPIILGRSELERWANCPAQAHYIESGAVSNSSTPAQIGTEVHRILSAAVRSRREDGTRANDLREQIEEAACLSRPDIQPQVLAALRRTWPIVDLICRHESNGEERSPEDLLRFDGGQGPHAGQAAADIEMPGIPISEREAREDRIDPVVVRLTCEVDLLLSTASPEELDMVDFKSGWTHWTATEVLSSFQFQFYSWVLFNVYPSVNTIRTRVFMTRDGSMTGVVEFRRRDMYAIGQRMLSAVRIWREHSSRNATEAVMPPAWPSPEKCGLCPAAGLCSERHLPDSKVATDAEGSLKRLIVLQAAAKGIQEGLKRIVNKGIPGQHEPGDLVFGKMAFGANWPRKGPPRGKDCKAYQIGGKAEESDGAE